MFKQSIFFATGFVVATFSTDAISINHLNKIGDSSYQMNINGRAIFEAYPEAWIQNWNQLNFEEIREDQSYIQHYPSIITQEEVLKLHREINYKEHRFFDVLGLSYIKYPKTKKLIQLLILKSEPAIYYLKQYYQRPRPYSVFSGNYLSIEKPKTASYPSKGATEGMLIALFLQEIFEDSTLKEAVVQLGHEIGFRRQLAGMAFPSDVKAGRKLAKNLQNILSEDKIIIQLIEEVKEELSCIGKLKIKSDDIMSFAKTGNILTFNNTKISEFMSQIQLLTSKRLIIDNNCDININETFPSNEWRSYLDIIAWENNLIISEDDHTIIITQPHKIYEK